MDKVINFYNTNKAYGCFSNFYFSPFQCKGFTWRTSEHYFQAMKFEGTEYFEELSKIEKPMDVARSGRDRNKPLRSDWESIKDEVMFEALKLKFDSNEDLRKILLSTGDAILVEHTSNDSYWGDGGDGSGKNKLGILLMRLRAQYPEYDGEFYLPQWIQYPDNPPFDMFWRMGTGETHTYHMYMWSQKWGELAEKEYERYFEPPIEWASIL